MGSLGSQQQQQQQGCDSIASGNHVITIRGKPMNEIEADGLQQIEGVPRLRLILADWTVKYKESQSRIDRKESLSVNVKNEIYHLIGFFSVFQGVVLTTVSQASALTCHNWWGPFALSLLCSIATLFGICHKFYNFFEWKEQAAEETKNAQVLKNQIRKLKKLGTNFNFERDAPDRDDQKERETRNKPKTRLQYLKSIRYQLFALWVILSMLGFSVIILLSCNRILCDST
jgi:uncharacterized membrane protein